MSSLALFKTEHMNIPEDQIVARAQKGDLDAFGMLVRQQQEMVYAVAFQVLGDSDDARDVCQECFIKLHREIGTYRPRGKFSTWLYRIVVNAAIDFQRRQKRDRFVSLETTMLTTGDQDIDLRLSLDRVLEELTPKQRTVFVLRDLQGFPMGEVAEILNCSAITVRVHLHNARRTIRKRLEQDQ